MLDSYLIKGILMGIVFGVPAGAVGVLTIRNSLETGFFPGFLTGLGSSVADLIYAVACVFGVTLISEFMLSWQSPLGILGGIVILALGVETLLRSPGQIASAPSCGHSRKVAGQFTAAFAIAIMNPATILSFFVAFAAFHVSGDMPPWDGSMLITGIFLGTCVWWAGLSAAVSVFRHRITDKIHHALNRVLGSLLVLLGAGLLINTLVKITTT